MHYNGSGDDDGFLALSRSCTFHEFGGGWKYRKATLSKPESVSSDALQLILDSINSAFE
jgi:hypothetical protein